MFDGKYMQLNKNGTFGWTRLTYVGEIKEKKQAGPSFGLMAPGYFWIDDVALVKVGDDVPLTETPVLGKEEAPIAPAGRTRPRRVRCAECGYRNMPAWQDLLRLRHAAGRRRRRSPRARRSSRSPRSRIEIPSRGGTVVAEHATDGRKALRIDRGYASMDQPQNWLGYDFLKADLYTDARQAAGPVRRDPRHGDARLLDPGQLHHGRPARARAR